jgi:outer membrane protein assembly factor BamA
MRFCFYFIIGALFFHPAAHSGQNHFFVFSDGCNQDSIQLATPVTAWVVDSIILTGNKTTRDHIILRELTFKTNDTVPVNDFTIELARSRENLLNTSLFNFVTIKDSLTSTGAFPNVLIKIDFIERWYLWPLPILEISERNFNTWWQDKDFGRLSYGLFLVRENMRGRMEKLNLLLRFGFDETYQMSYQIPYINRRQTVGTGFGIGYNQNRDVAYQTTDNRPEFVNIDDKLLSQRFYGYLNFTHRPSLYHYHLIQFNYNYHIFDDTLLQLNPIFSFNGEKINEYLTLLYRFTYDQRDSKIYPLHGDFFEGTIRKSGFGIFKEGDISMMELTGNYQNYTRISNRFTFGTDWTGKISTSRLQPYFYQRGLGYGRNFVRGYELYVVDGQSYLLSKNTLSFNIIPTRVSNFKFIKSEKFNKIHYTFYLNWFLDAGYVDDFRRMEGNELANDLMLGTGLGIDFVSYYDIVFRLEFSFNRLGEAGFFFHVSNTL